MTARAKRPASEYTAEMTSAAIEILPAKAAGKLAIDLKVTTTGSLFRIAPVRDPQEPRFWCVAVRKCVTGGMIDASEPAWIDRPGHPWADIAGMIEEIRDDVFGWLATSERRPLCAWLMSTMPTPPALTFTPSTTTQTR